MEIHANLGKINNSAIALVVTASWRSPITDATLTQS